MRDAHKNRWVEECHMGSLSVAERDVRNSSGSDGRVRITYRNNELDPSTLELLRAPSAIMVVYSTLKGFDSKFAKEEANSKKLFEDLKTMSLEKAQLESEKRFLEVRLDTLATKRDNLKAKYEVELNASKKCLKDARDHIRAVEAAQKSVEKAQKLAEEMAFLVETTTATANSILETVITEKDRMLVKAREEIERVKTNHADAEAKAVVVYQQGFEETFEYQDLAHYFMTAGGEELVEKINEVHPE
ncbi:Uncharacterized protein Adt_23504 [Abeliophyllum distichum]|uniref:Uncharacterized protein n=1 Tax=Abeliophyllum distichum TaxID=126358 RepID=A0ABD1SCQ9_9LAMI